jgi:hypothetical protein
MKWSINFFYFVCAQKVRAHADKNPPDDKEKGFGKVELFFYHLSTIPRLVEKIRAIDLKSTLFFAASLYVLVCNRL